ncbi:gametogenetin-binding protein 2-like [Vespa mandarinia]|uniref:gametogenetin-binding protein 2-like n=1 Tax=Vespa mandarinia TaxID=7446 RepID=UPI001611B508|nr:gametogenetin-binding protein 2-like [Vespa mandarinia]XP_035741748.1 gametogenetin-binding protein 2-like [Vespa mandarinia]XP_046820389.1 gametogenetin-binding protein 2-like [Vespa crabro]XP_047349134.1 gametogenetin-binding protein 2-like [Vespa velutina]XP_047349135.1 gametogenetin-binding protein 2-like [Vespa velutina]
MAKLVNVWRDDDPVDLTRRQMPLIVDENLTMIMDVNGLGAICASPLVRGKQLDEFTRKLDMLTKEEIKASFEVTCKDMLTILGQAVPCVGCRRSVERLFDDLMKSGHPALDPLIITPDGLLSISDDILESPQLLCTMLQGHSARLNNLVEKQPRNKKSRRCVLHSLEIQRMRPPPSAWREVWDCMELPCRQELALIETDTLDATLDTYLRKHRFCAECRTKVLLASSILTTEHEPAKETGYVAALYSGIKRCIPDRHVHLPTSTDYISTLIGRAQPELMGRERHAKTLEIAQEEVLTCLGICVAERLHKVHRRLREEETVYKVLAAVAVDALSRNFQMAVEVKQGISQLELLYEELTREEIAKQQRREKLRLKRKKKKERRYETEEKENSCHCSNERRSGNSETCCICMEVKPTTQNIDRHKLQVLDPKNKGPPTCKCPDCLKKAKIPSIIQSQSQTQLPYSTKKISSPQKSSSKKTTSESKTKVSQSQIEETNSEIKHFSEEELFESCDSCKDFSDKTEDEQWHNLDDCKDPVTKELVGAWIGEPSKRYTIWIEMKKRFELSMADRKSRSSSEQSSQDCGYSSEHNISSPSIPSTPEGSEVACSDGCCNHEGDCHDIRTSDKLVHSNSSISLLKERGGGPTLTQMLEDCYLSDDEEKESYIPAEEVLEFKSRMCQVLEKRQELRQTLRKRFAILCSHHKPFIIPH